MPLPEGQRPDLAQPGDRICRQRRLRCVIEPGGKLLDPPLPQGGIDDDLSTEPLHPTSRQWGSERLKPL